MGYETLPLCEAWFEAQRVEEGLFCIAEPHIGPLIRSNTWLLVGEVADLRRRGGWD